MADHDEINRKLEEVERLLRRIQMTETTRASRRDRANPSGTKRYGIGDARADAGLALSFVMTARRELIGTEAFLAVPRGVGEHDAS